MLFTLCAAKNVNALQYNGILKNLENSATKHFYFAQLTTFISLLIRGKSISHKKAREVFYKHIKSKHFNLKCQNTGIAIKNKLTTQLRAAAEEEILMFGFLYIREMVEKSQSR